MLTVTIDSQILSVRDNSTVLQAIRQAGMQLSTLCYWEGLPPYGACRLCLVEMTAPQTANNRRLYLSGRRWHGSRDQGPQGRRPPEDDARVPAGPLSRVGRDSRPGS